MGNVRNDFLARQALRAGEQLPERWLKRAALAKLFDVTPRTVTRWQRLGMPHMKQGGVVRFPLSECELWLRDQPDRRRR